MKQKGYTLKFVTNIMMITVLVVSVLIAFRPAAAATGTWTR